MLWRKREDRSAAIINRLDVISGQIGANNDDIIERLADKLIVPLSAKAELEIAEQFSLAGPIIVQRVTDNLESFLQKKFMSAFEDAKKQQEADTGNIVSIVYNTHNKLLTRSNDIEQRIAVIEGASLMHEDKAKKRTNYIIRGQEELAQQAAIYDASNGDRMLALIDRFRDLEAKNKHQYMLLSAKMNAVFSSLSAQINDLRPKARQHYTTEPSLEWLMDNLDEIIEMAGVASAIRDNAIPQDTGIYRLTKALRKLYLYSATDVRDEVVSKINSWENSQEFCRAA